MKIEERLTARVGEDGAYLLKPRQFDSAVHRLAAYEDTGLSPEEIAAMKEKQIPKPPELKVDPDLPHIGKVHYCSCGVMFPNWHGNARTNYCGNCGQRLK